MKRGFTIGLGVIIAGLLLELAIGPVAWKLLAWPANIVALGLFVALIVVLGCLSTNDQRPMTKIIRWLSSYQAAVPTMVYAVVLTMVMGFTRQIKDGQWIYDMLSFWPFVLIYMLMMLIVGLAIVKHLTKITNHKSQITNWSREIPFLLNHVGLFIALCCGTAGNPDMQRMKMICEVGQVEWRAMDENFKVQGLPLAIELKRFIMETYADGKPSRFASEIRIVTKSGKDVQTTVDVNYPYEIDGYKIYQYGYDEEAGKDSTYSILELVRDPWMKGTYVGIFMLLVGALWTMVQHAVKGTVNAWKDKHYWAVILTVLSFAVFFTFFIGKWITKQRPPALQSPWFGPHVIVYIIAYALLAAATLIVIVKLFMKTNELRVADTLVYIGWSFLTFGMLFGALWAKEAWGHYWSWDPKETWAAITWFAYLVYIHFRLAYPKQIKTAMVTLLVSFCLLQMCWWGINYLPSARNSSVHTYGVSK